MSRSAVADLVSCDDAAAGIDGRGGVASMKPSEWRAYADASAEPEQAIEPNAGVDGVGGQPPATAQGNHRHAHTARIDLTNGPLAGRRDVNRDRSRCEVLVDPFDEIRRATQQRDHF